MNWLKGLVMKLVGKKVSAGLEKSGISKSKLTAIVAVLVLAIDKLSGPVFGHPIVIPPEVFKLLEAVGLWSLRDAMDSKPDVV